MRDVVTKWRRLSLAGRKPRISLLHSAAVNPYHKVSSYYGRHSRWRPSVYKTDSEALISSTSSTKTSAGILRTKLGRLYIYIYIFVCVCICISHQYFTFGVNVSNQSETKQNRTFILWNILYLLSWHFIISKRLFDHIGLPGGIRNFRWVSLISQYMHLNSRWHEEGSCDYIIHIVLWCPFIRI